MSKKVFIMGLSVAILTFAGCTKSKDDAAPAAATARSYQGAGSRWEVNLTDTTFTLTQYGSISDTTADLTLSGTVTRNTTNKFLTMTVTSSSDENSVAVGTTVNGLEIPNTGVFIKTPDNATPLVAVVSGTCPTETINSNWIVTKPRLDSGSFVPTSLDDDGTGFASYNPTSGAFNVTLAGIVNRQLDMGNISTLDLSGQACSNGILAANVSSEIFDMYFTPSGFQIVKFPASSGDQIIFGLPKKSSALSATDVAGDYSVFVYRGGTNINLSEATLEPALVSVAANGSFDLSLITSVADNTVATATTLEMENFSTTIATSDSSTVDSNGMFHGDFGSSQNVSCTYASVDSTKVIACYGFTGSGTSRRPVTIVGHSR